MLVGPPVSCCIARWQLGVRCGVMPDTWDGYRASAASRHGVRMDAGHRHGDRRCPDAHWRPPLAEIRKEIGR